MHTLESKFSLDSEFELFLAQRKENGLLRSFGQERDTNKIDFYSNDYLGLCQNDELWPSIQAEMKNGISIGSSGSRLVSGQNHYIEDLEMACKVFFNTEEALFFPNGYMANLALLSSVASRHDTIIYDEQSHVSLKDGMRLSNAQKYAFRHNDVNDLEKKLKLSKGKRFVVVEAIYSMDGDVAHLKEIVSLCQSYDAYIIVDEAHSTGVVGEFGKGLCNAIGLEDKVWARNYTFGKALGASGAVLAISKFTKEYLINQSHPLIYSTAPMPLQTFICRQQLKFLEQNPTKIRNLQNVISYWNEISFSSMSTISHNENSPVQYYIKQGNKNVVELANRLQIAGFQIKAMLSPTVKAGTERLRISLHSYNSEQQIASLFKAIRDFENIFTETF